MSVRHALLALLSEGPKYGLQLREEFEARTGEVWPLNVGQVYTTLQRLERDGLVESDDAAQDGREKTPQKTFRITAEGESELARWLRTPPDLAAPPRDELVMKVLVAMRVPGTNVHDVIQVHRRYLVELMQQWTRIKEAEVNGRVGPQPGAGGGRGAVPAGFGHPVAGRRRRPHQAGRVRAARRSARAHAAGYAGAPEPHGKPSNNTKSPKGDGESHETAEGDGGNAMSVLEMRHVSRTYGQGAAEVHALDDVNLTVEAGSMVAVMGPSGSGKSTLLTIAGSLEEPTSGEVLIGGTELATISRNAKAQLRRRYIGYVFQDFNLLPGLTAAENVSLPLELDGVSTRKARVAGLKALDELGLGDRASAFPDQLSGGERQRVAIARAVVGDRRLLLADEPSGALDSANGEAVMRLIHAACKRGVAAVVVTHDAQLASWADRVVFLRDGRVTDQTMPAPGPESLLTHGSGQ